MSTDSDLDTPSDDDPTAGPGQGSGSTGRPWDRSTMFEQPGDRIGPFKLIAKLGEGGFGTVWLAERREPFVQRVALKLIKPGMDSKAVIARFEQERQALALMNHPNVAKVLDGGMTPAGRPYFVMEYVKGDPITAFCDARRLSIRERLALFRQACEAVQHAHLKGIIHRDLKPSNILAFETEGGAMTVKVIDFGVAKAMSQGLSAQTVFTEVGQMIGTIEYMSPEQADPTAADIDTRSDVYSLGVLLYELLTGTLPFDPRELRKQAYREIQRILHEVDPPTPSARLSTIATSDRDAISRIEKARGVALNELVRDLRRELEWIPLKAMRKEPQHRYQTALDLAEDIGNYLDGKALVAAPESTVYRMRKFVRRNRGLVTAAVAVGAALSTGLGGMAYMWVKLEVTAAEGKIMVAFTEAQGLASLARYERDAAEAARRRAQAQRLEIEQGAYFANIQLAQVWFQLGRPDRLRERLDASRNTHRGWEWAYLDSQADRSLVQLTGHTDWVNTAAFSPDGTRIVTASDDNTARIWNATTGERLADLTGHSNEVLSAVFSPDGTRVATASRDGTARIWAVATGESLVELTGYAESRASATVNPEDWLQANFPALAARLDPTRWLLFVAFSPDGTRVVAAAGDGTVRIWDATTGASLAQLTGHTEGVHSANFSPDGMRIVTASHDATARIWDVTTGESLAQLIGHTEGLHSAAFSSDGRRVVTSSFDGTARVWGATGANLTQLTGHTEGLHSAVFSPDGRRVVTASYDGTARIWDAAAGKSLSQLTGHTEALRSAVFSPDGRHIVTASDDRTVRIWDAATGASLARLTGHTEGVRFAVFSPDSRRIVTASDDKTGRIWNVETVASLARVDGGTADLHSPVLSPEDKLVRNADGDSTAYICDATTGVSLLSLTGQTDLVYHYVFDPHSTRVLTLSGEGTVRIWDATTGARLAELIGHAVHTELLMSAGFSYDGRRFVTGSGDGTARVWDAATGATLAELTGHTDGVSTTTFSLDDTRIVTEDFTGAVRTFDAVPYRIRFAERQLREQGNDINLGALYMKELRGESEPTWLSDPSLSKWRPNFMK